MAGRQHILGAAQQQQQEVYMAGIKGVDHISQHKQRSIDTSWERG